MRRAIHHHPAGSGNDLTEIATVTLAYDDRHRRRIRMTDDGGEDFLLDLEKATYLAEGDLLELDSGTAIRVLAQIEEVLDVSCATIEATARVAWHVGNRHTPVEVLPGGKLRLRYDHVLQHMLEGLGAQCERHQAPFAPEPGAYASGGGHGHHH